jgi:predicted nucleotidyltransferase
MERALQTTAVAQHAMLPNWLRAHREEVLRVAAGHGAANLRVFGSLARGEAGPNSDVDLLVTLDSGRSLLDVLALADDLAALLGRKVDILTDDAIYWLLRRRILGEAVPL